MCYVAQRTIPDVPLHQIKDIIITFVNVIMCDVVLCPLLFHACICFKSNTNHRCSSFARLVNRSAMCGSRLYMITNSFPRSSVTEWNNINNTNMNVLI